MALIVRYFDVTSAGAGDGTTWTNRAALFAGGVWSSVITGFSFAADSLECRIRGGQTYSITTALTGLSANSQFKLLFIGCDSSGNRLSCPDLQWSPCKVDYDYSAFPTLQTTGNISVFNQSCMAMYVQLKGTGISTGTISSAALCAEWCAFDVSGSGGSSTNAATAFHINNCIVRVAVSNLNSALNISSTGRAFRNRIYPYGGSTTGNRIGLSASGTNTASWMVQNCVKDFAGPGISYENGFTVASNLGVLYNTVDACGIGIRMNQSGSYPNSNWANISGNMVTNSGTYGITSTNLDFHKIAGNRLRNSGTADINGFELTIDNDTTAGTDTNEYVNKVGGDLRIRSSSSKWGKGFGAGDEMPAVGASEKHGRRISGGI